MNFIKSQLCLCILLPFLFFSCGERYNRGVLQEKKMVDVMVDVHLVEGMSEQNLLNQNNHSTSNVYYNNILMKHEITLAELDSSIAWYARHPKIYKRVYDSVVSRLEKQKSLIEKGYYLKKDTLNAVKAK